MKEIYLSRLWLNPRSRDVRRDMADCQQCHRTVLSAFPQLANVEQKARAEFGILYRLDVDQRRNMLTLLVQSGVAPNWNNLPDDYLLSDTDGLNPSCKPVYEIFRTLQTGMRLQFRLRANPTRCVSQKAGGKRRGKRMGIYDESGQLDWLQRQGAAHGFRLAAVSVSPSVADLNAVPQAQATGRRQTADGAKHATLTFGAVLFEGALIVIDSALFQDALRNGIGRGKAYGFGLLSVARPQS